MTTAASGISVVIPAYRPGPALDTVLGAALPQAAAHGAEVIVVESTADGSAADLQQRWPTVQVMALDHRAYPGQARNLGVARARGDVIVFLDADAVPSLGWLAELLAALGDRDDAVAGTVANGTPRNPTGTAGWLLEFSNWLPRPIDHLDHAASASLAVRRTALAAAGGFVEGVWPGEDTILSFAWGAAGRLAFAPGAVVHHLNRTSVGEFLRHQHALGRAFGDVCAAVPFPHRWMARRPWSALGGGLRMLALARRLRHHPKQAITAIALAPWLLAGLAAWTVGLWQHGGRR